MSWFYIFLCAVVKWLHSIQDNEDHLSRQRVLQGRDKEITKIFTSQGCSPSTGTHRDISILVQVSFFSNVLEHKATLQTPLSYNCPVYKAPSDAEGRMSRLPLQRSFPPLLLVAEDQDRMRQAALGVWALFNQLQTQRNLWPMTSYCGLHKSLLLQMAHRKTERCRCGQ